MIHLCAYVSPCTNIEEAARDVVELANVTTMDIELKFNNQKILVSPDDSPKRVAEDYTAKCQLEGYGA